MNFDKYKSNLTYSDKYIWSYNVLVGEIKDNAIITNKFYSRTTSNHLRYAAEQLNLVLVKNY